MGYKFNPFTSTFDLVGGASPYWLPPVATTAALPLTDPDGAARVVLAEDVVYVFDQGSTQWHNTRLTEGAFQAAADANGVSITAVPTGDITQYELRLHPADSSNPGGVSTTTQNFAGDKTFDNNVTITGDLTVNGSTTELSTTTTNIEDPNVTYNKGGNDASSEGAGVTIERTGTDGSLVYEDALASKFKLGALGSEKEIVDVSSSQSLTNKSIGDTNTINAQDDAFTIQDAADSSLQVDFDVAGTTSTKTTITSSQTANRTLTLPDATDTLVGKATTDILTNKTVDGTAATGSNTITTDADQVTYERADGSKKNIQATSDELEATTTDLDDAIGALDATPTNYTPSDATIVADHLAGIDTEFANKADTDLGNIVANTLASGNIAPDSHGTREVGIAARAWDKMHSEQYNITEPGLSTLGSLDASLQSTPRSGQVSLAFKNVLPGGTTVRRGIAVYTSNASGIGTGSASINTGNDSTGAVKTGDVNIATGDHSGTGNTGDIYLATGTPTSGTKGRVRTLGAEMDMGTAKVTNVVDPTADQDAATKKYVDDNTSFVTGDIDLSSFALNSGQATPANVINFSNAVTRSAEIHYSVVIDATAELYETGTLNLIQKNGSWDIARESTGDDSLLDFTMSATGVVRYTSPIYAGFVSGTMNFRAITTQV